MKRIFLWRTIIGAVLIGCLSVAYSGTPLWTFKPLTDIAFPLGAKDTATVRYQVYNQSNKIKTLVLDSSLTPGVQQEQTCFLAPKSKKGSCLLILNVSGKALPARGIHGGPVLCQANGTGSPNRNQCYQPNAMYALNIQKTNVTSLAPISISSDVLQLQTFGTAKTIKITNLSTNITAKNINALFLGTPLAGYVTASTCTSIAPRGSCTMTFTPRRTAVAPSTFTIEGANTTVASASLNVRESFVYVTGANSNTVLKCAINASGEVPQCVDSGVGNIFSNSQGIAINKVGTRAYVVNFGTETVSVCKIQSNGSFLSSGCVNAGGGTFYKPIGITLTANGSYAYIAGSQNSSNQFIWLCPILANGSFGACTIAGNTSTLGAFTPNGITLNANNSRVYISAPTDNPQLYTCDINESYKIIPNSCVPSIDSDFNGVHAISISNNQKIGYATNTAGGVSQCVINSTTGVFESCQTKAFTAPTGMALNVEGNRAYISSFTQRTVSSCPVSNGALGACIPSAVIANTPNLQFLALG